LIFSLAFFEVEKPCFGVTSGADQQQVVIAGGWRGLNLG